MVVINRITLINNLKKKEEEEEEEPFKIAKIKPITQVGLGVSAKATGGISLPETTEIKPLIEGLPISKPEDKPTGWTTLFQDPKAIEFEKVNFEMKREWFKGLKEAKNKIAFLKGEDRSPELEELGKKYIELAPYMYGKGEQWLPNVAMIAYGLGVVWQLTDAVVTSGFKFKGVKFNAKQVKELLDRAYKAYDPETGKLTSAISDNDYAAMKQLNTYLITTGKSPAAREMLEKIVEYEGGLTFQQQVNIFGTKLYAGPTANEIAKSWIATQQLTKEMIQSLDPVKVSQVAQQLLNTSPALASAFLKAVEKPEAIKKPVELSKLSEEDQLKATIEGIKPVYLIGTETPNWEEEVKKAKKAGLEVKFGDEEKPYVWDEKTGEVLATAKPIVIYKPENEKSAIKILDMYKSEEPPSEAGHIEIGRLLGYSDKEIEEFIGKPISKVTPPVEPKEELKAEVREPEIKIGDFVRDKDNLIRGIVKGEVTIGKNIPAYKIDIGGGRTSAIPKSQIKLMPYAGVEPTPIEPIKPPVERIEEVPKVEIKEPTKVELPEKQVIPTTIEEAKEILKVDVKKPSIPKEKLAEIMVEKKISLADIEAVKGEKINVKEPKDIIIALRDIKAVKKEVAVEPTAKVIPKAPAIPAELEGLAEEAITEKPAVVEPEKVGEKVGEAPAPSKEYTKFLTAEEKYPERFAKQEIKEYEKFVKEEEEKFLKAEAEYPAKIIKEEVEEFKPFATSEQIEKAHTIADSKNMISEAGKVKPQYRALAKAMTDKTSMEKMTPEEAEIFINALDSLVMRGKGLPPRIPTTKDIITQDFAEKIPKLNEIGIKEVVRPAWRVFQKIGLYEEVFEPAFKAEIETSEDLLKFNEDITKLRKTIGKGKEETKKLFSAVENPEQYKNLTPKEKKVIDWGVKFFDDWADKLKLEPEQRRKNYITHIFEKEIEQSLKDKYPLDPNIVSALDYITPKTIFNPYLQERLGKKVGLKEDFFAALNAYEGRALKKFYYEPLIQRIRVYTKYLPPNSARYLKDYITRITNRPLIIDREVNQSLKEAAEVIKKLPGGKRLATALTQGNASGMVAYNLAGIYYEAYMGFRPLSAIKNLSQHGLILSEVGPKAFTQALIYPNLKERNRLLSQSLALRSRKIGYLPGIDESFIKQLDNKRRKVTMLMFRLADKKNVSDAFLAGYFEAKNKGLPDEYALKRGDEVAQKTQYLYTKLSGPQLTQSSVGRIMGVLTTWPENWAELMNDWVQGKPSEIYKKYEKDTGKKITPTNWVLNRKSLWIYLGLVSLAMLIQRKTRLKALYYTGWTSLKAIADLASGQFAGLELPGLIAQLTAGIATGDMQQARTAARQLRPDRFIVITRELEDIVSGKKDWMNLFVYLEKEKKKKVEPTVIGKPSISKITIPKISKIKINKISPVKVKF